MNASYYLPEDLSKVIVLKWLSGLAWIGISSLKRKKKSDYNKIEFN